MNDTQHQIARQVETKLLAALEACEALTEFERTTVLPVSVAFTALSRSQVERWRTTLNEIADGTRTV